MDNMPTDRPTDVQGRAVERCQVDNVWATPSALHMRVTVWSADWRYRHKYQVAVPLEDIPSEAIDALWTHNVEEKHDPDGEQEALF